jgi:peptidoglycan/LPS O-acetylase OafA/YrhL
VTDILERPAPAREPDGAGARVATRAPGEVPAERVRGRIRVPYSAGLDGMRAVAVMAVLLYHAELTGFGSGELVQGGFLGVEVFFVISGYLITSILLAGWRNEQRVDFKTFYVRRARRLLPALFLTLAAAIAISVVFLPDEVATLRGDVAASLGYVTNWFFIISQKSYFESVGRPSLVQHLWSLAVEEQFYLVWPVAFAFGMRRLGRRGTLIATVLGAIASSALMAVLFRHGADITRVYEGTDTRAAGVLIGAALAFVWSPWRLRAKVGTGAALIFDVIGVVAGGLLLVAFAVTDQFSSSLYEFGFFKISIVTAVLIAVVVHPATRVGRALGWGPLRWVGLRSYGIYLFHWPIFQLTRPDLDVAFGGLALFAVRLVLTFAAAEVSYRLVEVPIRNGIIGRAWKRAGAARGLRGVRLKGQVGGVALVAVAAVSVLAVAVVRAKPADVPDYLQQISTTGDQTGAMVLPPPATTAPTTAVPETTTTVAADPVTTVDPAAGAAPTTALPAPPTTAVPVVRSINAIGDSVMLGAAGTLQSNLNGQTFVDARVGRQVSEALGILHAWQDQGRLGDVVLVHIGNNGVFKPEQFEELKSILAGVPKVVIMTVKVPRAWEGPNNDVIVNGAASMPNAVLVDWKAMGDAHPELFWSDGMHLRPDGAAFYASQINSVLG